MLSFALSESLIIISLSLPFVKYFLKIFFRKFSLFPWLALEQPIHYITFSSLCQVLFQNFFSEVFDFLLDSLRAAYILYHFFNSLSIPFQKVFSAIFFASTRLLLKILPMLRQQAYSSLSLYLRVGQCLYYIIHYAFCQLKLQAQFSGIFVRNNGQISCIIFTQKAHHYHPQKHLVISSFYVHYYLS